MAKILQKNPTKRSFLIFFKGIFQYWVTKTLDIVFFCMYMKQIEKLILRRLNQTSL